MNTNETNNQNVQPTMFTPPTGAAVPENSAPVLDTTTNIPVLGETQTLPVVNDEVPVLDTTAAIPVVPTEAAPVPENTASMAPVTAEVPVLDSTTTIPVVPTAMANTQNTAPVVSNPNPVGGDTGGVVPENLKSVEINYKPPSKFKTFLLIVFFVFLIAFVIFLPEITTMINLYKAGDLNYTPEKITTGKLKCTLDTNTTNLDKSYDLTYNFTDNKLEKTSFIITTRGDATLDEATLDELAQTCQSLATNVESLEGITVQCSYTDGKLVETQHFDLKNMNVDEVDEAFIEAGGNNPEYQYGQDMDIIERSMNASGYTCKREG